MFAPDWGGGPLDSLWDQRLAHFERILRKDLALDPRIQESVESDGLCGVTLGCQERRIYHWHEESDRRIGSERIRGQLRVAPVLDRFVNA